MKTLLLILLCSNLYAQSYNRMLTENQFSDEHGKVTSVTINFLFDVTNDIVIIKRNGVETKFKIYLKELGNQDYNLIQCKNMMFLLEVQTGNVIVLTGNEKCTFYNHYRKS